MSNQPQKRHLKKSVKLILLLIFIFFAIFLIMIKASNNHVNALQSELLATKGDLKKSKKQIHSLQEEVKFPLKSYELKTRKELQSEKLNSNLILQTDERWANKSYGWGTYTTVDKNACAIASLSMINAYWKHTPLTINSVLNWAKNDYFTDSGTSWSLFPAFAKEYGYEYKDLGTNISNATSYLKKGIPVVISVKPGKFTSVGHIMVLSHFDGKNIRLLDPNDDAKKKHTLTNFSELEMQQELTHIWVFTDK